MHFDSNHANRRPNIISRRKFLAASGAAAVTFTVAKPGTVKAADANSKINLGMIGCGGRGTWITPLFGEHGGYNILAAADYFPERVKDYRLKFQVPEKNCFSGLSCYEKMLDRVPQLDAVAIISPPYFHPEQAGAAVDAGKHVYLAKPVAVDVPGCHSIERSGQKATDKNLCFLVDFQTRANEFYREAVKKVQFGTIGKIFSGQAYYVTNRLGKQTDETGPEARLKNWTFDKVYSGDIITEQNIHVLDVASWIIGNHPLSAYGSGGRAARTDVGDCWDHFNVIFNYPEDVTLNFCSKQGGKGYKDIACRVYGSRGTIDTHYGGTVNIRGQAPYKGGETPDIYRMGAVHNIADFHENITKGRFANTTVAPSVRSNLTTIIGRAAAYSHGYTTWDQVINANEKLRADLSGLKK